MDAGKWERPRPASIFLAVALALAALSAAAVRYVYANGWLQWYGDAEAHLNNARRLFDSLTPGYDQIGTPWLPLPHLMMLPFVRLDAWWRSGLAGAFPAAFCFVAGGLFLFAAVRRIFSCTEAAVTAVALAALNPNLLYLQSTSMTEAYFFAALVAVLYGTVRGGGSGALVAALATVAATLTRYEGWFLIPFVTAYFLVSSPRRRLTTAILYGAIASLGPLYWLGHNWYLTGDALAFYRGPYSARAIQGGILYPGFHNWRLAWMYYRAALELCAGPGLPWMALAGAVVALAWRAWWPLLLLALPPAFYVWSVHSSWLPIHVPGLWPHSWYNTRYGLAALPLLAFAAAALVMAVPPRMRAAVAVLAILAGSIHWAVAHQPADWITWAESRANSIGRRGWTAEAARYLGPRYRTGAGILSSGGDDFFGIYRAMGVPLAETFSVDNGLPWDAAMERPELYFWQEWAVVRRGDPLDRALARAATRGISYQLEEVILEKDEPVIEIYRRSGGPDAPAAALQTP